MKIDKNVVSTFESVTSARPAVFKHNALNVDGTAVITYNRILIRHSKALHVNGTSEEGIKLLVTNEITASVNPAFCKSG